MAHLKRSPKTGIRRRPVWDTGTSSQPGTSISQQTTSSQQAGSSQQTTSSQPALPKLSLGDFSIGDLLGQMPSHLLSQSPSQPIHQPPNAGATWPRGQTETSVSQLARPSQLAVSSKPASPELSLAQLSFSQLKSQLPSQVPNTSGGSCEESDPESAAGLEAMWIAEAQNAQMGAALFDARPPTQIGLGGAAGGYNASLGGTGVTERPGATGGSTANYIPYRPPGDTGAIGGSIGSYIPYRPPGDTGAIGASGNTGGTRRGNGIGRRGAVRGRGGQRGGGGVGISLHPLAPPPPPPATAGNQSQEPPPLPPSSPTPPSPSSPVTHPPPSAVLPPSKRRRTDLAIRYSHPVSPQHQPIAGSDPLKSGMTPLSVEPNSDTLSNYQRMRFLGFTAAELHSLEALAPLNTDASPSFFNTIPIHAFWIQSQWVAPHVKHMARWPIRKGRTDYWEVENPLVWAAMEPALQLASLFIKNSSMWGWWDALFRGNYTQVAEADLPPNFVNTGNDYKRFFLRTPTVYGQDKEVYKLGNDFLLAADQIEFQLFSGYSSHDNGMPRPPGSGFMYGCARDPVFSMNGKTTVFIAYELIEPLLRTGPKYTPAERMVDNFRLACTILHETTHAMWRGVVRLGHNYRIQTDGGEPYFENECIQELGFSIENALFGGCSRETWSGAMTALDQGKPSGGIFQFEWNRITHSEYSKHWPTLLSTPGEWMEQDYCPIPIQYFMDLHKDDFWNTYTKRYGGESTHMGPKVVGYRRMLDQAHVPLRLLDWNSQTDPNVLLTHKTGETQGEDLLIHLENDRRRLASKIRAASAGMPQEVPRPYARRSSSDTDPTEVPPEPIPKSWCPRYDVIRKFLCRRDSRRDLALDTMNFTMPEHTLLGYIVRNGKLQPELTPDEWRNFLIIAHHTPELFSYNTSNAGLLTRISAGWPTNRHSLHDKPPGGDPTQAVMDCFLFTVSAIENIVFKDGFLDCDWEEFYYHLQLTYKLMPEVRIAGRELPTSGFSRSLFARCVSACWAKNHVIGYGPTGVIRKITPGFTAITYTERNRDVLRDACFPS